MDGPGGDTAGVWEDARPLAGGIPEGGLVEGTAVLHPPGGQIDQSGGAGGQDDARGVPGPVPADRAGGASGQGTDEGPHHAPVRGPGLAGAPGEAGGVGD